MLGLDRDELKSHVASRMESQWEMLAAVQDPAVNDVLQIVVDVFVDMLLANNSRVEEQVRKLVLDEVSQIIPEIP